MADYIIGDLVRVYADFTDIDGTLTDPTEINLSILYPDGTEVIVTYAGGEIIRSGVGMYYYDIDLTLAGIYKTYWWSEGPAQGAGHDVFHVTTEYPAT